MIERNMTDKQKNKIGISKISEPNSKGRLLFLEHYLLENTDDENPITAEQLIKAYEDHGYKAHRNTIRDDIDVLQASGMDIISGSSGKYKTFCVGSRLFEPAEVKTLADAVASSRFITKEKSEGLIKKLTALNAECLVCKYDKDRYSRHIPYSRYYYGSNKQMQKDIVSVHRLFADKGKSSAA